MSMLDAINSALSDMTQEAWIECQRKWLHQICDLVGISTADMTETVRNGMVYFNWEHDSFSIGFTFYSRMFHSERSGKFTIDILLGDYRSVDIGIDGETTLNIVSVGNKTWLQYIRDSHIYYYSNDESKRDLANKRMSAYIKEQAW